MASRLVKVAATGNVRTGSVKLRSVVLTPAAALSTLDVRDGSGGNVIMSLQAAASGASVPWMSGDEDGVVFGTAVHATLVGAGASATFEIEE